MLAGCLTFRWEGISPLQGKAGRKEESSRIRKQIKA